MDTKELVDKFIDDVLAGQNTDARETFDAAISQKITDALEVKKLEVAQAVYSKSDEPEEETEEEQDTEQDEDADAV